MMNSILVRMLIFLAITAAMIQLANYFNAAPIEVLVGLMWGWFCAERFNEYFGRISNDQ